MKTFLMMLAIGLLMACQPQSNKSEATTDTTVTLHEENEESGELTLNNGNRWKADSITNVNVSALSKIITEQKPATLEDYHAAAQQLQAGIEKLLMDCRMKGDEHEALHHWLEPIMESNGKLAKSTTVEEASTLYNAERERINIYPQYFE